MFKLKELVLGYFVPAKPGLETHWGLIERRTLYDVIFQEATRKSNVLGIISMSLTVRTISAGGTVHYASGQSCHPGFPVLCPPLFVRFDCTVHTYCEPHAKCEKEPVAQKSRRLLGQK